MSQKQEDEPEAVVLMQEQKLLKQSERKDLKVFNPGSGDFLSSDYPSLPM